MAQVVPPPVKAVAEATRPRFLDYLLILSGLSLSVLLSEVYRAPPGPVPNSPLVRALPTWLFLSLGVVLLWPIFYMNQRILGRKQELTWAEWLWGLAWLGSIVFALWIVWKGLGSLPGFMATEGFQNSVMFSYVLFVLSTGGLAAVLFIGAVLGRLTVPWTHTFGLALLMWPVVPLGIDLLLGIKLE